MAMVFVWRWVGGSVGGWVDAGLMCGWAVDDVMWWYNGGVEGVVEWRCCVCVQVGGWACGCW